MRADLLQSRKLKITYEGRYWYDVRFRIPTQFMGRKAELT